MGWVYIIKSISTGKCYIGSTNNVERRLAQHNSGKSLSTKGRGPWEIVVTVEFPVLAEARSFEYRLKELKNSAKAIKVCIELNAQR